MSDESEKLREAAKALRVALDPEATPHDRYVRFMLDLAWPLNLARWFEAAAEALEERVASLLDELDEDLPREAALATANMILQARPPR